jgi:integrase
MKPPTPVELAHLLRVAEAWDAELTTFVMLSAATGARRSEIVALRWRDLSADFAHVTIAHAVVMGPDGLVEKDTKTHQARRVTLDATTAAALVRHRTASAHRAKACGSPSARRRCSSPATGSANSHGCQTRSAGDSECSAVEPSWTGCGSTIFALRRDAAAGRRS